MEPKTLIMSKLFIFFYNFWSAKLNFFLKNFKIWVFSNQTFTQKIPKLLTQKISLEPEHFHKSSANFNPKNSNFLSKKVNFFPTLEYNFFPFFCAKFFLIFCRPRPLQFAQFVSHCTFIKQHFHSLSFFVFLFSNLSRHSVSHLWNYEELNSIIIPSFFPIVAVVFHHIPLTHVPCLSLTHLLPRCS